MVDYLQDGARKAKERPSEPFLPAEIVHAFADWLGRLYPDSTVSIPQAAESFCSRYGLGLPRHGWWLLMDYLDRRARTCCKECGCPYEK